MDLKKIYRKYSRFIKPVLYCKNRLTGVRIHSSGQDNTVTGLDSCRAKGCTISISGNHNMVEIGDMSSLFGVHISINGSGNRITLGPRNFLNGAIFCIEDDNNTIRTGEHTYIYNNTEISAIESTVVSIGNDCLFSGNIMIRTGDSHVIMDKDSGVRINHSADISIADHVWLGNGCKILKGTNIGSGCVVATGAIITSGSDTCENAVLAGIPAKITKKNIIWKQERS